MTLKASWLWNGSGAKGQILFGFSETWYTDLSPAALFPLMKDLAQRRLTFLAAGTQLYGYRIADTAPNSRAFTQRENTVIRVSGRTGPPNVPQDAVLCQVFGTVAGTSKRFWFHNLPDTAIDNCELTDEPPTVENTRRWIDAATAAGFKFRHIVQSAPTGKLLSIDAAGNVLTAEPITGIAPRALVQLLKVRGVDGRGKRGKFYVDSVTSDFSFKLAHWPGDIVAASGKIRLVQYGYTSIAPIPAAGIGSDITIRPGVRKCGRPFGQLRGRAVAKR